MPFQLDIRMALFARAANLRLPEDWWRPRYEPARSLLTVHWSADPALGIPTAPYVVELAAQSPSIQSFEQQTVTHPPDARLDAANGMTLDLGPYALSVAEGLFYVRFTASAPQVTMFAIGIDGEEIPGTMQTTRTAGSPVVFFGPGIMGVRALSPVQLASIRVGIAPRNIDQMVRLATVAPVLDKVAEYAPQEYLGRLLSPREALKQRLSADRLARDAVTTSGSSDLDNAMRRELVDPTLSRRVSEVLSASVVQQIAANFLALAADPRASFKVPLDLPGGTRVEGTYVPAAMLQLLAANGPIEACALGAGVTIPSPTEFFPTPEAVAQLFLSSPNAPFPMPVVRVTGRFGKSKTEIRGYARPTWTESTPNLRSIPLTLSQPEVQDGPAHGDVELAFPRRARLTTHFLARRIGQGVQDILLKDRTPKPFLAVDTDPAEPPHRISRIVDPQVPRALDADSTEAHYVVYSRDEFGRWAGPARASCSLAPWPVQAPTLMACDIVINRNSGDAVLVAQFSWNWTLRRPSEIRIGIAVRSDSTDPGTGLLPEQGVTAPTLQGRSQLRVLFGSDPQPNDLPTVQGIDGSTIAIVAPPPPETTAGEATFNRTPFLQRTYRLSVPIGPTELLFSGSDRCNAAVVADALELVSGKRRSAPSRTFLASALDPREPQISVVPWKLVWASRPNPANESRAVIVAPVVSGASVAGLTAWRAHESSLLDCALEFGANVRALVETTRAEQNMHIRLALLEGLFNERATSHATFRQELIKRFAAASGDTSPTEPLELTVPGGQSGLELIFFTARSATGQMSDKTQFADVRAVAVPHGRPPARPSLSIVPVDSQSLDATGACLFIVSAPEGFEPAQVRAFSSRSLRLGMSAEFADPEELFLPFRKLWPISIPLAKKYVENIEAVLDRQIYPSRAVFLSTPPPDWNLQLFTIDLKPSASGTPLDDVPSARAPVVSALVLPATVPKLKSSSPRRVGGGVIWSVAYSNLPSISRVGPSRVQIEVLAEPGIVTSLVAPLGDLSGKPLSGRLKDGRSIVARQTAPGTLEIAADFLGGATISVVGRDPLDRWTKLVLAWK